MPAGGTQQLCIYGLDPELLCEQRCICFIHQALRRVCEDSLQKSCNGPQPEILLSTARDEVPFVVQMRPAHSLARRWLLFQSNKFEEAFPFASLSPNREHKSCKGPRSGKREKPLNAFSITIKIPLLCIQLLSSVMCRKVPLQSGWVLTKVRVILLFKTFQITFNILSSTVLDDCEPEESSESEQFWLLSSFTSSTGCTSISCGSILTFFWMWVSQGVPCVSGLRRLAIHLGTEQSSLMSFSLMPKARAEEVRRLLVAWQRLWYWFLATSRSQKPLFPVLSGQIKKTGLSESSRL